MESKDECRPTEPRRSFHFMVDVEKLVAYSDGDTAELTVREILDMSGNQPPDQYQLMEVTPERKKFEDLNQIVLVRPESKFKALHCGPTPVS